MASAQVLLRDVLVQAFADRQARNKAYSLRAFARNLDVDAAALSQILRGKRSVSKRMAARLLTSLGAASAEQEAVLSAFEDERMILRRRAGVPHKRLTSDQFEMVADWYHFAIVSLLETRACKSDPAWIAGRLGLSTAKAEQAIERLIRLRMVSRTEAGDLWVTGEKFNTSDSAPDQSIRKNHLQALELARQSIAVDELETRDFSSVTFAIDMTRLPDAKRLIREFIEEMTSLMAQGERTEVYRMSTQLFPLTKSVATPLG